MGNYRRKLTAVLVLMSLVLASPPASCTASVQDVEDVLRFVRTPEDLARWFSSEFTYRMVLPDGPHTLQEILRSKAGDCDDLAGLASAVLTRLGIPNEVIVIRFKKLTIAHAVCAWKDAGGRYNFISNRELIRTGERTLEGAVARQYPDYDSVMKADPQMYVCL